MSDAASSFTLTKKEFILFRDLIYREAGISMGAAKHQLVESRLSKRLRSCGFSTYQEYYDHLMKGDPNGEERLKMINCLTTNKTDFFREDHHFQYLRTTVFPDLEKRARETGDRKIRIWSAACSTGEEPYTLAMTVLDHFGPTSFHGWDIRVLASDVDTDVLSHAQKGVYAADRVADIPKDVLKRHFLRTAKGPDAPMMVRPELQELVTFRRINFIEPTWPINAQFDVIFCRNVMIYFDEETQDRLLTRFADYLKPGGHLFIGHSESILRLDRVYKSLGNTIYSLREGAGRKVIQQPASGCDQSPAAVARSGEGKERSSAIHRIRTGEMQSQSIPEFTPAQVNMPSHAIIVGEVKASAEPMKITTLVGSCVAVCLFDPEARIGGMNHFMLPASSSSNFGCATYGVHAMELLINRIMKLGGDRRRLVAKVFGGGNVLGRTDEPGSMLAIGERNAQFATEFLQTDGIPVLSQSLGGTTGRQIQFLTHTGQAFVRPVEKSLPDETADRRRFSRREVTVAPECGSVELFESSV
jgi:chemotaxis protein methyltransferase CheR